MISHIRDLSLRAKITLSFVLIVLGGTFISTSIGSRIIANAMRREALKQASRGLETAGSVYAARLDALRKSISAAAARIDSPAPSRAAMRGESGRRFREYRRRTISISWRFSWPAQIW